MAENWENEFNLICEPAMPTSFTQPDPELEEERLKRNRQSAKASRERKKAYVKRLEDEVARLSEEVTSLKLQ
jgi:hypothetical protein